MHTILADASILALPSDPEGLKAIAEAGMVNWFGFNGESIHLFMAYPV